MDRPHPPSDLPVRLLFPDTKSFDGIDDGDRFRLEQTEEYRFDKDGTQTPKRNSPTSVLFEFTPSPEPAAAQPPTITVDMDDEGGVEMCLGVSSLSVSSATKSPYAVPISKRARSLMDDVDDSMSIVEMDLTFSQSPSPSPKKKLRIPTALCGDSSAVTSCNDFTVTVNMRPSHKRTEQMIEDFLGASEGTTCADWQTWTYFGAKDDRDYQDLGTNSMEEADADQVRSALRNRAHNMSKQMNRVRELRSNMDPFGTPRKGPALPIVTSKSFIQKDHGRRKSVEERPQPQGLSSLFESCTAPQHSIATSPAAIRKLYLDDEVDEKCYDSDPEEFTRRRHTDRSSDTKTMPEYTYPSAVQAIPTGTRADIAHDCAFSAVVQEFMNDSVTLVKYDRCDAKGDSSKQIAPVAVQAWIERGQRLRNIYQPKLVWKLAGASTSGNSNIASPVQCGVDLLDITRIQRVEKIDRCAFPLAHPHRCFRIATIKNQEYFFEAQSRSERNRFVYSLKLLVARFGAKIVVADDTLFDEFFTSGDAGVPGEAPGFIPA